MTDAVIVSTARTAALRAGLPVSTAGIPDELLNVNGGAIAVGQGAAGLFEVC